MCEWLATAEWCDVQLLCGGRVFGAHRAVLASVSGYLRKILLSCHGENTPTLIILPDFDLDAMYSVLYYIYNGEVAVPKSRLESFLDVIVTLKIFIDKPFLGTIKKNIQGLGIDFELLNDCNTQVLEGVTYGKTVFKLKSNYKETVYVCIKKGLHSPILMQEAPDDGDDRELRRHPGPYLQHVQSLHGARQKRSLRDSFIEPHPRNGNVNGQSEGVPAILNEHYLVAASAFLTNANSKSHCVDLATDSVSRSGNRAKSAEISSYKVVDTIMNITNSVVGNVTRPVVPMPTTIEEQRVAERKTAALLDLSVSQSIANAMSKSYLNKIPILRQCIQFDDKVAAKSKISVRRVVSNHVMQSPWSSNMPLSYKPSCPKLRDKANDPSVVLGNDSNNNIEKPLKNGEPIKTSGEEPATSISSKQLLLSDFEANNQDEQTLPDQESVGFHSKRHTSARFTCPECGKTFSQLRNFKYHMSVHRGTREFAATCSICGKHFNDRGYLSSHMKIHRNRKEYKCHLCPKSFNQRVAYNMHVRIHTGVKPHACEQCGKAFSRKMLLKQHQRTHSGERPYACAHCGKRFADRSNMTLHLRLHTGVKPFSCSLCPKSFTKKHHLKSHLNFHTGAKPYSCPRCHLAFTQSSNMRTHLKKCNAPLANCSRMNSDEIH